MRSSFTAATRMPAADRAVPFSPPTIRTPAANMAGDKLAQTAKTKAPHHAGLFFNRI
jgi:hypothetical protein